MGKNITIYFNDEVLELIEKIDGKGTLINQIIIDHFSNDEDVLRRNMERLDRELNIVRAKLEAKLEAKANERLKREANLTKTTQASKKKREKYDKIRKGLELMVKNKEITFEEYRRKSAVLRNDFGLK